MVTLSAVSYQAASQPAPETFTNPILPGFFPDPSICRVGDTFYLVNSSFEMYPGLPIHQSKDLVNWELIGHALHRPDQVVLPEGLKDSNGIFAPTIRWQDGLFYVITTCVGCGGNFIVTSEDPSGPWSDAIWIKDAIGIDPSLFWEDGKCFYLGAGILDEEERDEWQGKNGIWMQGIDLKKGTLLGKPKQLTHGHASNARWAEGPHLYKVAGEYLLLIGEGGTNEYHAVTVFNSKNLWGSYVPNHANPVLTHRHLGNTYPIGQTGHADLVQTSAGDWWSVMLAKRAVDGITPLARETFLAKVEFRTTESGQTPIFNPGKGLLQPKQKRPDLEWNPTEEKAFRDDFEDEMPGFEWNMLRNISDTWYRHRGGKMELDLRPEQMNAYTTPSFLGRRVQHHQFEVTTLLDFSAENGSEKAGLSLYRRAGNNYQLLKDANGLKLIRTSQAGMSEEVETKVVAQVAYEYKKVILHLSVEGNDLQFSYGRDQSSLTPFGETQDMKVLSDEMVPRFNGVYVGMYATSTGKKSKNTAEYDWFEYKPRPVSPENQ